MRLTPGLVANTTSSREGAIYI